MPDIEPGNMGQRCKYVEPCSKLRIEGCMQVSALASGTLGRL